MPNNKTQMNGDSLNIAQQKQQELERLFPGIWTETKNDNGELVKTLDVERLKAELGESSEIYDNRRERYGMDWPGKKDCLRLIQEPSQATLNPCREESVDFDTTENLFIEGDNLEVLKLLQKSYYGEVKMIYIDPPYNTGNGDFIYQDNFSESLDTYLECAGLKEVGTSGRKWSSSSNKDDGRYHTKWLNMMFPRLYLARNLLREDGVIFISIDDSEIENLRRMCNEIFGEENQIACLVWDKNRKNDAKYFSVGHEYMLVYAKREAYLSELSVEFRIDKDGVEELKGFFKESLNKNEGDLTLVQKDYDEWCSNITKGDPREAIKRFRKIDTHGPYRDDGNINWPGGNGPRYEVLHPKTGAPCKVPKSGWRYPSEARFWEEYKTGRVVFGVDESTVPRIRTNLFENSKQVMNSVNFSYAQTATNEFIEIFDGKRIFDNPKPISDIERLIRYVCDDGDLILDFFCGSATTGHACFTASIKSKKEFKFILVQLPEPVNVKSQAYLSGFNVISEISKERIRRAGNKIRQEQEGQLDLDNNKNLDFGFKVLKLNQSNFKQWQAPTKEVSDEDLVKQFELNVDHIDPNTPQEYLLYELLIKAGVKPTVKIEAIELAGHSLYSVAEGILLIHLALNIQPALIEAVVTHAPQQFICLDDAFRGNDQLKTNAAKTFEAFNQGKESIDRIEFQTV
ncbi:site-specific DNA-methyltransferase [Marinagarivorans algicola]|uniref:site-specific DNA-methyltransferase n=1 Tax=Marinagarivorans algicola TaxID=1513270 RepID=UPI0006B58B23|nr:DNA methyltransferase [Marinagarivorans algicola]